jgi:16S rRNA (adenine1518-N6/adenine1519-N6)-dimethyltransferase
MHPRQLLENYNLEAKKSLGQNFLYDEHILERIAGAADITAKDQVLEIGPGLGALTRQLARRAGRVVAVELEGRFVPILQAELSDFAHVTLIQGDILDQNPAGFFHGAYKVVANVPYYITGAILRHLLEGEHKPTLLVLTVQQEVAQRITAVPPNMSLLSVSVQYYGRTKILFTIKAGAFWPRPDVDSAVVRIDLDATPAEDPAQEQAFFRVVRTGFSQKRKQLQKNLRQLGLGQREIAAALEEAGIAGSRRAETLTIAEWQALVRLLPK